MKLKVRGFLISVVLVHVLVFAVYLTILQGIGNHETDIHGILAVNRPVLRYANMTSRNYNQATSRRKNLDVIQAEGNVPGSQPVLIKSSNCKNKQYPYNLSLEEGWYPVDDAGAAYVFSAYHDERESSKISIIGAKRSSSGAALFCQIWKRGPDGKNVSMLESVASTANLPESHGRKYHATIISCAISKDSIPETVSIVTKKCSIPLNLLMVKRNQLASYSRSFTVCLTPLNMRYGRAYELVEWIEMNRILGAEYFTLYNYSTARNVWSVLDYYKGRGLVEVVNWNLPMAVDTWPRKNQTVEIHYFGQMAALNECWRRNRKYSEYLVYTDLDEFIVPRGGNSRIWRDIIKQFPSASALQFQNVFFRKEWDAPNLTFTGIESARKYRLVTLLKTVRENRIFAHNMRSKYIVRADSAMTLGIHNIVRMRNGRLSKRVPADVGLLFHYRNWENAADKASRDTDSVMIAKYKDDLIERVQDVWSELPNVEMDIPLT